MTSKAKYLALHHSLTRPKYQNTKHTTHKNSKEVSVLVTGRHFLHRPTPSRFKKNIMPLRDPDSRTEGSVGILYHQNHWV